MQSDQDILAQKRAAEYMQAKSMGDVGGCSMPIQNPVRRSLLGLVEDRLHDHTYHARKSETMQELRGLLLKNPDVARILELMEEM